MKLEKNIQMVDLYGQYNRLKDEIDAAMQSVIKSSAFINGPQVKDFSRHLADYLKVPSVVPCGNGTDALHIALMALNLQPGDEVIVPAFTYVAAAEVVGLMGMTPVLVDVDPYTFNLDPKKIEQAISRHTKAIITVHLFGQCCEMEPILRIASLYNLYVVEDNAQSIGAEYTFANGTVKKAGTIGHIGTTSFFPSKPLACYGDGGAIITSDSKLAEQAHRIANHGQERKYHHKIIGCNSRLDTLQAAILDVKLKYFDEFTSARIAVAREYDKAFEPLNELIVPRKSSFSTHIYHQYTLQVQNGKRDAFQAYLKEKGVPSMIYYPLPLQTQEAYKWLARTPGASHVATRLSQSVLSLPIHTEMTQEEVEYIIETVQSYA